MALGLLPPRLLADKSRFRHLLWSPHPHLIFTSSSSSPTLHLISLFYHPPVIDCTHMIVRSIWANVRPLHQGAQRKQTHRWLNSSCYFDQNRWYLVFHSPQELGMTSGGVWRWGSCSKVLRIWSSSLSSPAGESGGRGQVQHGAVVRGGGQHHSRSCKLLSALVPAGTLVQFGNSCRL